MYLFLAAATDVVHALAMVVWALGLPLLLWHRWPRMSAAYTAYALLFIVASQASHALLGECFLTTVARALWSKTSATTPGGRISFTTRLAETVAGISPSEQSVVVVWEAAILLTAVGVLVHLHRTRHGPRHARTGADAMAR